MFINEEKGDIFELDKTTYTRCICISKDCAMGAGIAKQFKDMYPTLPNRLLETIKEYNPKIPFCIYIEDINLAVLVTKEKYWNLPNTDNMFTVLNMLKNTCIKGNINNLAMNKLGCTLDKQKWSVIKGYINDIFEDTDINIEVRYL